jgi:hypothetical protein
MGFVEVGDWCSSSCLSDQFILPFGLGPRRRRELLDLGDLGRRQACGQILQIIEWIDAMPSATAQQGIDYSASLSGFGMRRIHTVEQAGTESTELLERGQPILPGFGEPSLNGAVFRFASSDVKCNRCLSFLLFLIESFRLRSSFDFLCALRGAISRTRSFPRNFSPRRAQRARSFAEEHQNNRTFFFVLFVFFVVIGLLLQFRATLQDKPFDSLFQSGNVEVEEQASLQKIEWGFSRRDAEAAEKAY